MCTHGHLESERQVDNRGRFFCRICRNEAANRHYHNHRDRILSQMQEYYQQNCEEKRAKARIRYAADPERVGRIAVRWIQEHPQEAQLHKRARNADRRARQRNQFIESVDPQTVFEMHGGMCGICEGFIEGDFEVDHVIPLVKGGMHGYINVQPAHPFCNRSKGSKVFL